MKTAKNRLIFFQLLVVFTFGICASCIGRTVDDASVEGVFLEQIGVCTSLANHELLQKFGYSFIEENLQGFLIPFEPHESFISKLELLKSSGLPVKAVNVFLPGSLKSVGPDIAFDDIVAYADTAFRRAEMAGIQTVVFGSGGSRRIPDGFDKQVAEQQFVELLKRLGPVAAKYNVFIAIEPLNRGEVNFINTVAEGLELVNAANHPNIRLLCDFFHMLREDEPADHIIQAAGYIQHVHVAEKAERTPPGVAGDDFKPYIRALKKIGYSGGISVEARWSDFEKEIPIAIEALRKQINEVIAENE
jgi:sugar phosphate isomerase/epimerase